jgi:hypothetical protein
MATQQAYEEKLKTKPKGRPINFSKAKVKTLPGAVSKMAKPSNFHNKPKFSRVTHQVLSGAAKTAPQFKNPMLKKGQPTKSVLGKVNQTV